MSGGNQDGPRRAAQRRAAQIRESILQPRESLLEDRTRRGEVETQPGVAARSELRAGTGENARAALDPAVDLFGRKAGAEKSTHAR
jgi:hypothetical protein